MASALSAKTLASIALAEATPLRLRHHLQAIDKAPLAVQHAMNMLALKVANGERLGDWPPHRPGPTVRRRAHVGLKRAQRLEEKRADGLCLGVKHGRIEYVERGRLMQARP